MHTARKIVAAALAVMVVGACTKKDEQPVMTTSEGEANLSPSAAAADARGRSMVRVVNAVDGGRDVTVQLDDSTLFAGVKPASVTDYREVSTTLANFSVREPGAAAGTEVAENDEMLMDGNRYTVILVAEDMATRTLRVVKDEVIPDSGKARIRVIHAAPGAPSLDVRVAGAKDDLFSDVDFKSEAGFKEVEPANVTLEFRGEDAAKVLLRIPNVNLKLGTSTTIVVTGAGSLKSFSFTDAAVAKAPNN